MKRIMFWFLTGILRSLVRSVGWIFYKLKVNGLENIPKKGGALLVANHVSYVDFVLMVCSIPRKVQFVMNAGIFAKPGLNWLLRGMNCIPVDSGVGQNNLEAFNQAVCRQIAEGNLVVIFAEGTVSRTGQLLEFKKGVEHLSRLINSPIIPIHFDNLIGTPFTFRAGKRRMIVPGIQRIRSKVYVNIGSPEIGEITAFRMRQRIKELEVESFVRRIENNSELRRRLLQILCEDPQGSWKQGSEEIQLKEIPRILSTWSSVLDHVMSSDKMVGVLLPPSLGQMLVNLYLLMKGKCSVNIDPAFDNEERMYISRRTGFNTLITTKDLTFSGYAPNAQQVIFIEDIMRSVVDKKSYGSLCSRFENMKNNVSNWFRSGTTPEDAVTVVCERKHGEIQMIPLTGRGVLGVITGLRQVYYFEKNTSMLAALDLCNAYGYVLQLLLPAFCELRMETLEPAAPGFTDRLLETKSKLVLTTPTQLAALAEVAQVKNLPFLTTIFTADIDPAHHAVEILIERGLPVMTCAGMNSTSSVFAVNIENFRGPDIAGKTMEQEAFAHGSIGKPLPGVAVKVVSQNSGKEVEPGEVGQIHVKGNGIVFPMTEHHTSNENSTLQWFDTGWQGRLDNKGFLFLETSTLI